MEEDPHFGITAEAGRAQGNTTNDSSSEEAGVVKKVSSKGEDPYGDESGNQVKYKIMSWQYDIPPAGKPSNWRLNQL